MKMRIFWFFWIVIVFLFAFLVPPFQKPDEPVHFYRVMTLLSGQFSCTTIPGKNRYFSLPQSVYDFPNTMQTSAIVMKPDGKFPIGLYKERFPFLSDTTVTDAFQYCQLPFLSYIPFSLSALISYPFDNLLITFFSMRAMAAILFICFSFIGFLFIPKRYRLVFLFIIANPMFIHQTTAVSYDAISNILIIFIVPLWLRCMEEKKMDRNHIKLLVISLVSLFVVKPGYYFLTGIILPIITKISLKKSIVSICIGSILLAISALFFVPGFFSMFFHYFLNYEIPQIYIIFHDPWYFMTVVIRTVMDSHERLTEGMIGLFGWLDYRLPLYGMLLYAGMGGVVVYEYVRTQKKSLKGWVILLLGNVCVLTIVLIFYSFYRAATPAAYYIVESIQGRYFLPLLPFFMIFCMETAVWMKVRRLLPIIVVLLGIIFTAMISSIIYTRYYDYSRSFSNPDELVKEISQKTVDIPSLSTIVVDSRVSYQYDVLYPGYKIGAVQMIADNELEVDIPYKLFIKDKACRITLYEGYLNELLDRRLAHLKGKDDIVVTQHIPITPIKESGICLELEPVMTPPYAVYLRLLGEGAKPVVRFLYIAK